MTKWNPRGPRGFKGPGGGSWTLMPDPAFYRGTSVQVCGLWPFAGAAARPLVGVPVGQDMTNESVVCCDPISWFHAGLAANPSMMLYGEPGVGKSSFAVRQILGLADQGVTPLVLGDLKPDYPNVIRALTKVRPDGTLARGQVITFGGSARFNVLDQGRMIEAAQRIGGSKGEDLLELALSRSAELLFALMQIVRRRRLEDWEQTLLSRGVRILDTTMRQTHAQVPTLPDLAHLINNPPAELMHAVLAETEKEYRRQVKPLARSLEALLEGPLGRTFSGQTTERIDLDAPGVCIDISAIGKSSDDVLAAVMLTTWSEGFASVEAANALADAGVEPQRNFLVVMDEMWKPMRVEGAGLIDRLDAITRLNRTDGVGNIFISHTPKDQRSMTNVSDVMKATGFTERAGIVVTGGLAREDLEHLSAIKPMSEVEIDAVSRWATPPGWTPRIITDPVTGKRRPAPPPGCGKVLIKLGGRAGIQTQVRLTHDELSLHETNGRWLRDLPAA